MSEVNTLIISDRLDFTTDYICFELNQRKTKYLRLNRDEFEDYEITFDITSLTLTVKKNGMTYSLSGSNLKSIYFRAPIYLRDIYQPNIPPQAQLYRTQWAAFVRDLAAFEEPLWVNNPVATFQAENKLLQIEYAKKAGFTCPTTLVTNVCPSNIEDDNCYIVKSVDTAVLRIDGREAFVYSNVIKGSELKSAELSLAPVIIQDYIQPKIDIRVTVIGDNAYPVKILSNGEGVVGDWRQVKNDVEFIKCILPLEISGSCINLVRSLGLSFGAIDLIESDNKMYFLEINPTGEWGWLVHGANLPIHKAICDLLDCRRV